MDFYLIIYSWHFYCINKSKRQHFFKINKCESYVKLLKEVRMKRLTTIFMVLGIISFFPAIASSAPISIIDYTFSGTVTSIPGSAGGGVGLFSFLNVGDPYQVNLTYAYDPDASSPVSGFDPTHYWMPYPPSSLVISVDDMQISIDTYPVNITNADQDSMFINFEGGKVTLPGISTYTYIDVEGYKLSLRDSSGTAFSNTDLPIYINPLAFDSIQSGFELSYGDGIGSVMVSSNDLAFKSMEVQPVPEPTTLILLGSGLFSLIGFRRKLKK
jgi:hypothetical protein